MFIFSTKWLFASTIFFVPFTGTAVFNIGDPQNGSAVQPYMFLLILCLTKSFFAWTLKKDKFIIKSSSHQKIFNSFFLLFCFIVIISVIMPVLISGTTYGNLSGKLGEWLPISFTNRNITQVLYFLLGVFFSYFVYNQIVSTNIFLFLLKVYGYSVTFIIFWGFFEFICNKIGLSYPALIFNNSSSASVAHGISELDSGVKRVSSVAAEPSILAQSLVVYLPFLLAGIESNVYIFSKLKDKILLFATILLILLTTSSSGILSLLTIIALFYITRNEKFKIKAIKLVLQLAILTGVTVAGYILFTDLFNELFLKKSESYSAAERLGSIVSGWNNFLEYPYLGVGWGSITVNDLFIKILSNTGLIGASIFIFAIYYVIKQHLLPINVSKDTVRYFLNRSCLLSMLIMLFNCEVAGFSFYFGTFWLTLGFCMVYKQRLASISKHDVKSQAIEEKLLNKTNVFV